MQQMDAHGKTRRPQGQHVAPASSLGKALKHLPWAVLAQTWEQAAGKGQRDADGELRAELVPPRDSHRDLTLHRGRRAGFSPQDPSQLMKV